VLVIPVAGHVEMLPKPLAEIGVPKLSCMAPSGVPGVGTEDVEVATGTVVVVVFPKLEATCAKLVALPSKTRASVVKYRYRIESSVLYLRLTSVGGVCTVRRQII
jgi:hypothetical protein